jgi:hypothetical protein
MSSHEKRIDLAYSKLGLREPFIAAVMTRVKREITTSIPTAATNGSVCKYNPDFMDKWDERGVTHRCGTMPTTRSSTRTSSHVGTSYLTAVCM